MMPRQLDLFPPPAHRWQTLTELDAIGEKACQVAQELHAACPDDPRATRALFNALVMFGAAEILKRRGYPHK
jgi:hypothetical protein